MNPRPEDPFLSPRTTQPLKVTGWSQGDRLLLVGAAEIVPQAVASLYLKANRDLPSITLFASASVALECLAEQSFDCIVVVNTSGDLGQRGIDAASFCIAARAAGNTDALLVWAQSTTPTLWSAACETDAEMYVGPPLWNSDLLLSLIDRATRHRSAARENHRRNWAEQRRAVREREDCAELVQQQRGLLQVATTEKTSPVDCVLPPEITRIYHELLRSCAMTGTTSFATEIAKLARTFVLAHLTPRQVLQLHVEQLEVLIKGIGQRSARHIIDRANLLCTELLLILCECIEQQNARTWWAWRRQPVSDLGPSLERRAA